MGVLRTAAGGRVRSDVAVVGNDGTMVLILFAGAHLRSPTYASHE